MNSWDKWIIIIPARMASTRLPEKPLADLLGRPLVLRVFDRVRPLQELGAQIVIATDHPKILDVCLKAGVEARMTDVHHQSGTDRCAEVARHAEREFILNVQGDEPFVNVADLERLMSVMQQDEQSAMGTLIFKNDSRDDYQNPNIVKVVRSQQHALYFSRAQIPYYRDSAASVCSFFQHLGIYAYRRQVLFRFCALAPSALEMAEKLEQLRALEAGIAIRLIEASMPTIGIDTPADLQRACARLQAQGG